VPLWPETIEALQLTFAGRSLDEDDLCFTTAHGNPWVRIRTSQNASGIEKRVPIDALSQRFAKLLKSLDINGGRGFYACRHTFETIAGESRDQVAVDAVMGHVDTSMAATYRERISDERLQAVVDVVRAWLWPEGV
jgi:integrase